jgi:uncharacterized protein (DUF983 family)
MFKKGTKIYSIFNGKCPKCHEDDFFKYGFTFNPSKVTEIHTHCSECNLKYMLEPSFFYGAMYINYGITVAISIAVFIITKIFIGLNLLESFLSIFGALIILAPLNLRLARIIWINMFVAYDKDTVAKKS